MTTPLTITVAEVEDLARMLHTDKNTGVGGIWLAQRVRTHADVLTCYSHLYTILAREGRRMMAPARTRYPEAAVICIGPNPDALAAMDRPNADQARLIGAALSDDLATFNALLAAVIAHRDTRQDYPLLILAGMLMGAGAHLNTDLPWHEFHFDTPATGGDRR